MRLTVLSGRPHCLVRLRNDWMPKPLSSSLKPNAAELKAPAEPVARCSIEDEFVYPGLMMPGLVKQSCKGRVQLRQRHALTRTHTHTRTHARDLCVCTASASKVLCHALAVGQ